MNKANEKTLQKILERNKSNAQPRSQNALIDVLCNKLGRTSIYINNHRVNFYEYVKGLCNGLSLYYLSQKKKNQPSHLFSPLRKFVAHQNQCDKESRSYGDIKISLPLKMGKGKKREDSHKQTLKEVIAPVLVLHAPRFFKIPINQYQADKSFALLDNFGGPSSQREFKFSWLYTKEEFMEVFPQVIKSHRMVLLSTVGHMMGFYFDGKHYYLYETGYQYDNEIKLENLEELYVWLYYAEAGYDLERMKEIKQPVYLDLTVNCFRYETDTPVTYPDPLSLFDKLIQSDGNALKRKTITGCNVAFLAVLDDNIQVLEKIILLNKEEINPLIGGTVRALGSALQNDQAEVVELLLKNGAKPSEIGSFYSPTSPLSLAMLKQNYRAAKSYLLHVDPAVIDKETGKEAIYSALASGEESLFFLLLEKLGYTIDSYSKEHHIGLLHAAIDQLQIKMAEKLLELGYDPNEKNGYELSSKDNNYLPTMLAAERGQLDFLKHLHQYQASNFFKIKTKKGNIYSQHAIVNAAKAGHSNIVKYLYEQFQKESQPFLQKALKEAVEKGHVRTAHYLIGFVEMIEPDLMWCNLLSSENKAIRNSILIPILDKINLNVGDSRAKGCHHLYFNLVSWAATLNDKKQTQPKTTTDKYDESLMEAILKVVENKPECRRFAKMLMVCDRNYTELQEKIRELGHLLNNLKCSDGKKDEVKAKLEKEILMKSRQGETYYIISNELGFNKKVKPKTLVKYKKLRANTSNHLRTNRPITLFNVSQYVEDKAAKEVAQVGEGAAISFLAGSAIHFALSRLGSSSNWMMFSLCASVFGAAYNYLFAEEPEDASELELSFSSPSSTS